MKNHHKFRYLAMAAVMSVTLLSGCTDTRLEDELAFREIGIADMQKGDYESAVTAFSSALSYCVGEITDTEIDICYYKAAAQYAAGDLSGALETYQALVDYNEEDAKAHYLRGRFYLMNGESEKALADFSDAVTYNGSDWNLFIAIYENLAAYHLEEEGKTYLEKALEVKGSSAEKLACRGKAYYLLGEYEDAVKELTAAIEKGSKEANLTLARAYEAKGDSEQAQRHYEAYVASGAASSETLNTLAEMEMKKGNYAAALEYIKQGLAMETVTNREALLSNQVIACEYTADFTAALAAIEEYLALCPEDAAAQREYVFLKNRRVKTTPEEVQTGEDTEAADTEHTEGTEDTENTDKAS